MVDFLLVGQGLAGTLLSHFLLEAGKKVVVIDNNHEAAASKVAAGLINPVTGRRIVKSWRFDEFLAAAQEIYPVLEKQLGISFFHQKNVLRALYNVRQENDWFARCGSPDVAKYLVAEADIGDLKALHPVFSWGELRQSAQVELPKLILAYRQYLINKEAFLNETFAYDLLEINERSVRYKTIEAKQLIFCEGYQSCNNPYFQQLPHQAAKGEVLLVKIPELRAEKIIKHGIFLVPLGNEMYWVGSSYIWDFTTEKPTDKGRSDLEARLKKALNTPYEILDHLAAIRPVFRDRRPMIGFHPEFPLLGIFNGFGTKGASQAPYWARHFSAVLCEGLELDKEVNCIRSLK